MFIFVSFNFLAFIRNHPENAGRYLTELLSNPRQFESRLLNKRQLCGYGGAAGLPGDTHIHPRWSIHRHSNVTASISGRIGRYVAHRRLQAHPPWPHAPSIVERPPRTSATSGRAYSNRSARIKRDSGSSEDEFVARGAAAHPQEVAFKLEVQINYGMR